MKALRDLKRFIKVKDNDDERAEIRLYVAENADPIAAALGVTPAALKLGLDAAVEDTALVRQLLGDIKHATRERRDVRTTERARRAQESADVLASVAYWDGERCVVDLVSLLASALTRGGDSLAFSASKWELDVAIRMDVLAELARLERADLSAWVDERGLHVRWTTGGLNLHSYVDPSADRIVMNLPAPTAAKKVA